MSELLVNSFDYRWNSISVFFWKKRKFSCWAIVKFSFVCLICNLGDDSDSDLQKKSIKFSSQWDYSVIVTWILYELNFIQNTFTQVLLANHLFKASIVRRAFVIVAETFPILIFKTGFLI